MFSKCLLTVRNILKNLKISFLENTYLRQFSNYYFYFALMLYRLG